MGLFSKLFGQKQNSKHHHFFAHLALRQLAFNEPVAIFLLLPSDMRIHAFDQLLNDLDSRIPGTERRNFTSADISVFPCTIDQRPCVIIQMPEVRNPAEAYFIGILSRLPHNRLTEANGQPPDAVLEYYTLERPNFPTVESPSAFCAWTSEGTHINFGDGPEPTREAFLIWLRDPTSRAQPKVVSRPFNQ
jgi:hypothetical protein